MRLSLIYHEIQKNKVISINHLSRKLEISKNQLKEILEVLREQEIIKFQETKDCNVNCTRSCNRKCPFSTFNNREKNGLIQLL